MLIRCLSLRTGIRNNWQSGWTILLPDGHQVEDHDDGHRPRILMTGILILTVEDHVDGHPPFLVITGTRLRMFTVLPFDLD